MKRVALTLAVALSAPCAAGAFPLEPAHLLNATGVAPLYFAVPNSTQWRAREQVTGEVHATYGWTLDAAGVGGRLQVPLWPGRRRDFHLAHDQGNIVLSVGLDVLARFGQPWATGWRGQLPVTMQYEWIADRRLGFFVELGATPELRGGERPAFVVWPTGALGLRWAFGALGPSGFGAGPPYRIEPTTLLTHPPTSPAFVVRVGFPAGLQVGFMF